MSLLLTHPELPTCADCKKWIYSKDWERSTRAGEPIPRRGGPLPCFTCPKGKKLFPPQPNPNADLSAKNSQALALYHQVKAGLPMPDDPIVRQNCGLIRMVEDAVERARSNIGPQLAAIFGMVKKKVK